MPVYGIPQAGSFPDTTKNLTSVGTGDSFVLFNAESPAPGTASVAFCRAPSVGIETPSGIIFTASWATAPTAELDVQGSNVDVDAQYQTLGSITNQQAGYYSDFGNFRFYRVLLLTQSAGGALTVIAQR